MMVSSKECSGTVAEVHAGLVRPRGDVEKVTLSRQ